MLRDPLVIWTMLLCDILGAFGVVGGSLKAETPMELLSIE
jgi:hypothetical protein